MTIDEAITANPKSVVFGYRQPRDGVRVDDPPEIAEVIRKARGWAGAREVPWADALPVILALRGKVTVCGLIVR